MRNFVLSLLQICLLLLGSHASSGELRHQSFQSQLLNQQYRYLVYLPDGY
jgi:hypothetical protein